MITYEQKQKSTVRDKAAKEAVEVGAGEIFQNYKENEVGADQKYKGKWLKVKGKVSKIGKDITDDAYLLFDVSDALFGVRAEFEKENQADLTDLAPGQTVVVVCQGEGKFADVMLGQVRCGQIAGWPGVCVGWWGCRRSWVSLAINCQYIFSRWSTLSRGGRGYT